MSFIHIMFNDTKNGRNFLQSGFPFRVLYRCFARGTLHRGFSSPCEYKLAVISRVFATRRRGRLGAEPAILNVEVLRPATAAASQFGARDRVTSLAFTIRRIYEATDSQPPRAVVARRRIRRSFNRAALTMHLYSGGLYVSQLSRGRVPPFMEKAGHGSGSRETFIGISARNRTAIHPRCEYITAEFCDFGRKLSRERRELCARSNGA